METKWYRIVASQQKGTEFKPQVGPGVFLCGVCVGFQNKILDKTKPKKFCEQLQYFSSKVMFNAMQNERLKKKKSHTTKFVIAVKMNKTS